MDAVKNSIPTWSKYLANTWEKYLPPIRPAEEEIQIFGRFLQYETEKKGRHLGVLILGSTPELRDLAHSHQIVPTVVDYSEDNYRALALLMKKKGHERFVNQNWLNLELKERFDIILCEASLNVIKYKEIKKFLHKIRIHLKPNGLVVSKIWVRLDDQRPDITELISDYRKRQAHRDFYSAVCLPLFLHFYDYEKEVVSVKHMSKQMEKLYRKGVVSDREWETIRRHEYENVTLELTIPHIKDLHKMMKLCFHLKETLKAGFEYSEYHPIFILTPIS